MIAVVLIVLLRLAIGWHFFYEGVWKQDPRSQFTSKGFLGMAKGPTKDLYYVMLPDLEGTEKTVLAELVEIPNVDKTDKTSENKTVGEKHIGWTLPVFETEWNRYLEKYTKKYQPDDKQKAEIQTIFDQYVVSLREYAEENEEAIAQFKGSLARYKKHVAEGANQAAHQKQRDWDNQMKLRGEGSSLAAPAEKMGADMELALWNVLTPEQKNKGMLSPMVYASDRIPFLPENPWINGRMRLLDLTVTIGLSAIGLCLMLGFCSRLAALGGAAFLFNVCLSQFPWPGVYPPSPEVVGHFMWISKDSVELLALLVIAALPAGRWGGLDFFLWNWIGKPIYRWYGVKNDALDVDVNRLTSEQMAPGQKAA